MNEDLKPHRHASANVADETHNGVGVTHLQSGGKLKAIVITSLILAGYIVAYRICGILVYLNYLNTDHGIGRVLEILFIPLGYLEQRSKIVEKFFAWLSEVLASPFF